MCGVSYSLSLPTPTQTLRTTTYMWTALAAPAAVPARTLLHIHAASAAQPSAMKEVGLVEAGGTVRALLHVPGEEEEGGGARPAAHHHHHQIWAALEGERSILVYAAR